MCFLRFCAFELCALVLELLKGDHVHELTHRQGKCLPVAEPDFKRIPKQPLVTAYARVAV